MNTAELDRADAGPVCRDSSALMTSELVTNAMVRGSRSAVAFPDAGHIGALWFGTLDMFRDGWLHPGRHYPQHMDVALLYFDGCPNWGQTRQRLAEALSAVGADPSAYRLVVVTTAEEAERLEFRGSPTVLVDGQDPFADPDAPVGLACRVYLTPEGLRGAPTVEQLVAVLT